MLKYEKIIPVFVGLLVVFFILIGLKWIGIGFSKNSNQETISTLREEIKELKREQTALKMRLGDYESMRVQDQSAANPQDEIPQNLNPSNFIVDIVTKDNIDLKAKWSTTNKDGIYVLTIRLDYEPQPGLVLVWTGMGMLPVTSYSINAGSVSIATQQTREMFIASNNFVNVLYVPNITG